MRIKYAIDTMARYRRAGVATMLWGPPGIGKTAVPEQIAASEEIAFKVFKPVLRETVDLRGIPAIDLKKRIAEWLPPAELPNAERDGEHGIWLFDELNVASVAMQNACLGVIQERQIEDWKLPKGWDIVATGNHAGQGAVTRMPPPLANRFGHIEVTPNIDDWVAWANGAEIDIDPQIIGFLQFKPQLLHDMEAGGGENNTRRIFPTPRTWHKLNDACGGDDGEGLPDLLSREAADDKGLVLLREHVCAGLVGPGPTAEFLAFLTLAHKAPSLAEVLARPKETAIPAELGILYTIVAGLQRKVDDEDAFKRALTYIRRTGKREFEVMFVMGLCKRSPKVQRWAAFVEWAKANASLVLV